MVTRKPNPNPPYPTSPIDSAASAKQTASINSIYSPDLATSPAFDLVDMSDARRRPRRHSDLSSHGTWDSDGEEERQTSEDSEVPSKQNIAQLPTEDGRKDELPASLRPGLASGAPAGRASQGSLPYADEAPGNPWAGTEGRQDGQDHVWLEPSKPYLRQQPTGESSQKPWPSRAMTPPPPPSTAPPAPPVELPTAHTPVEELSKLSLPGPADEEPFHTADVIEVPSVRQAPLPPVVEQQTGGSGSSNPWRQQQPTIEQKYDGGVAPPPGPPPKATATQEIHYPPPAGRPPTDSLIERLEAESAPYLPPQAPVASAPSQPPRPGPISTWLPGAARLSDSVPETPGTTAKRQRSEQYQIKHINWLDASATSGSGAGASMRRSPILTQNANGPCPLLALVNALVLSTPRTMDTALVETLSTREQVSLGLLLDAVFDELMSGRRGDTAHELPDVSELYAFLLALHTGMNVNPRFITPATAPRGSLDGHPQALNGVHPMARAQSKAGCFEETKEMRLYSTFNVPLIHGWTPPRDTVAYEALERSAQTFEDAQNIQFAELELEHKLRQEGLSAQEEQTLQDIQTIKQFLTHWPTQLTDHGLQNISSTLRPGLIAILFRNDHFSTLYKEPRHGALMTLVTDAGYGSHEEIVWESLVDVNGAASEMFSGDFRVVSHNQDARLNQSSSGGGDEVWETVPNGRSRNDGQQSGPNATSAGGHPPVSPEGLAPPLPGPRPTSRQPETVPPDAALTASTEVARTASEQQDHDLALALQLQEEEEDEQRQAEQRRRREQELSEQFLSSQSDTPANRPAIPPRRSGRGGAATPAAGRQAVNRPSDRPFDLEAPPTYEQAASDRPFREAGSTAPPHQGNPLTAYDALRRQQSAYAQHSSTSVASPDPQAHGWRRPDGNRVRRRSSQFGVVQPGGGMAGAGASIPTRRAAAPTVQEAEEKCAVM